MSQAEKAACLRDLHNRGAFLMPNIWNVGSAQRCASMGFRALGTTSAGIAVDLGRGDGEVGREHSLAVTATIASAIDLPLSADLENGFAHAPDAAAATLIEASALGAAGGSLEDATNEAEAPIYPFAVAVERVLTAVAAIRASGRDFVLTARAENFLHGRPDLADTIARLQAFEAAGADVLFAPGLPDEAAIRAVRAALRKPINILMPSDKGFPDFAALAAMGVNRVSVGSRLARAAERAEVESASVLRAAEQAALLQMIA